MSATILEAYKTNPEVEGERCYFVAWQAPLLPQSLPIIALYIGSVE
jgi:hypothetical protein